MSSEHLEAIAKETGFKQRASIITPESFLNTLFFSNTQCCPTLSEYSIDLGVQSSKSVSKQAIDKRFNDRTKAMLARLLQEITSSQIKRKSRFKNRHFSEIRIMDSTEFVLSKNLAESFPGYGGTGREAIAQVQLEYDLLGGKVTELSLGSALDSDSVAGVKHLDQVPAHALLVRDLGYFSPKVFEQVSKRNLYFVSRAKPQWSMFEKMNGEFVRLTVQDIKERLLAQSGKYLDTEVFVGSQTKVPARLVASMLTEKQTSDRVKRKKANRGPLSKLAQESACLNLFVTNVEKDKCNASQIYGLYTLRWQIELIFKTWKSVLCLHKIHPMNAVRLECVILVKLIWAMLNWSLLKLVEQAKGCEISLHRFSRTLTGRSKALDLLILQSPGRFVGWLERLCEISDKHHRKEYKKGSKEMREIINIIP